MSMVPTSGCALTIVSLYLVQGSSRSPKDSSFSKRIPKLSAIKVINFGSTTYDCQDQSCIVSTRHYRAPDVIFAQ
jgi:hypothetical protein